MPDHHELLALAPKQTLESMTATQTTRSTLTLTSGRGAGENRTPISRSATPALRALRTQEGAANAVDTVPLKRLTAGRKALKIAHAGETYLLRITKANKLILTKPAADEKPPADTKV